MNDRAKRSTAQLGNAQATILAVATGPEPMRADRCADAIEALSAHAAMVRSAQAGDGEQRRAATRSIATVEQHLAKALLPAAVRQFRELNPVANRAEAPVADLDTATIVDLADLLAAIGRWEFALNRQTVLRAEIHKALSAMVSQCKARLTPYLELSDDTLDVRIASRDLLRIEAVHWAVEAAGGQSQAAMIRDLSNQTARRAILHAARIFTRFTDDPDEFHHFDAVGAVSAVDDLLVLLLQVLEGDRTARDKGVDPFVLTIEEQALQDFVTGLQAMTQRYAAMAGENILATGPAASFIDSVVKVLQRIASLVASLSGIVQVMELGLNQQELSLKLRKMRDRLRRHLKGTEDRQLRSRLQTLEEALSMADPHGIASDPAAGKPAQPKGGIAR